MAQLNIITRDPATLTPRDNNARTHSARQIKQIANSIEAFGFTNPILIDDSNKVIAGHGRLAAAQLLGLETVPTIRLENLSRAEIRAYVIADNKLAENAGWDSEILAIELQDLMALDLDFDVSLTGFEMPEIDLLISGLGGEDEVQDEDIIPAAPAKGLAVTRPGDLWVMGDHRLLCGDALKAESYKKLLGGEQAQMVFIDPPYNVRIDGHVSGKGAVKHKDFAMACSEMSQSEFTRFLHTAFTHLAAHSTDGAIHYVCMDWRHMGEVLEAGNAAYTAFKNLCVWAKTNGGMGSLYRSQHELVFVFKSGARKHINNVNLGKYGRNRTNLWTYAGQNSFGKTRDADLTAHPTVKPVRLIADALRDCSHRNGLVLDAFAGSGATLLAAHKTGRRGAGLELDPHYCDVIIERMRARVGLEAVHEASGKTFEKIQGERQTQVETVL